ncbi:class I SAM-dependent methyltransferase [Amycolatopsis sp. NPDC051373]|uniref:class I SAM-dependent methyltransferase n=1 Tax=Amycolatopsis sp. NPDC051373 TaxID=3155801 RepID=UPI00344CE625
MYDQPAAFTAFIRGGGNVSLYERLSAALAARYAALRPESLLDLGCGDGLAVVPALAQSSFRPGRIDLVEPSAALLADVDVPGANRFGATARSFLGANGSTWNLAQSTFAMQSMTPPVRAAVLRELRPRTETLVLAEFDIPVLDEGSPEFLESLVTRYECGVAEYGAQASLVAQGFSYPFCSASPRVRSGRTGSSLRWRGWLSLKSRASPTLRWSRSRTTGGPPPC